MVKGTATSTFLGSFLSMYAKMGFKGIRHEMPVACRLIAVPLFNALVCCVHLVSRFNAPYC
eukprot:4797283-Amphidinium_carterae.1